MKPARFVTSLNRLLLLATVLAAGFSVRAASSYPNVLSAGPFNSSPQYFYINTKIPFNPNVAPQIHITGYMYSGSNKALDVTLGWYMWNNAFLWTQYQSGLSFAKPSRIRLGTYDDAGTTRVRIEIANDGVYWTSYFISATDILGYDPYYTGWTYAEGTMPSTTGLITDVPLQGDVQISGNLTANNFSNGLITGSSSGLTLNAGGTNQNVTLTPSGSGYTILNGNVGIGTPSPLGKLDVKLATNQHVGIYNNGGVTTLSGLNDAGNLASLKLEGSPLLFGGAGGVEHMRIDSAGDVGIGTQSPRSRLDIGGSLGAGKGARFGDYLEINEREVINNANTIGWNAFIAADNGTFAPTYAPGTGMVLSMSGGGTADLDFLGRSWGGSATPVNLNSFTPVMRLSTTGNIGIGTQSPAAKLHIVATSLDESNTVNFTDTLKLQAANGGTGGIALQSAWDNSLNTSKLNFRLGYYASGNQGRDVLTMVANTGYVGIGTTAPGAPLEIKKPNGGGRFQFLDEGADVYSAINVRNSANNAFQPLTLRSAGFTVNDGTADRLTVAVGGNIGVGTTTPNEPFEIGGTGRMFLGNGGGASRKGLLFDAVEDGTYVRLHAYDYGTTSSLNLVINPYGGGNVGIGTTNPTQKLSVNGTIRAKEIIVDTNWADYVFDANYRLAPLSEVEQHIKAEKHLPGIPSAQEIAEHGVSMGDMQSKLLSKIEELTLHMIAQEKEIAALRQQVGELKAAAQP